MTTGDHPVNRPAGAVLVGGDRPLAVGVGGGELGKLLVAAPQRAERVRRDGLAELGRVLQVRPWRGRATADGAEGGRADSVGAGGGLDVDIVGGAQDTGVAVFAEATAKLGMVGATVGGELDLGCMNGKLGAKAMYGFGTNFLTGLLLGALIAVLAPLAGIDLAAESPREP